MPTGVQLGADILVAAIRHYPIPLLLPLVFTAGWVIWVLITGNRLLLKKGLKFLLALLLAFVPLFFFLVILTLGAIGGGAFGKGMEFLSLLLIALSALLYFGLIPFLIAISWKAIMRGPVSIRHYWSEDS